MVSRDTAGGAEQVLAALDAALTRAGHRSTVVAMAGSRVAGRLVATPAWAGEVDDATRSRAWAATREAIALVADADLVHLHGIDFARYLPPPGPPVLATLHLPPDWYDTDALTPRRPRTWVHGVSISQHARIPPSPALLPPIANGVDVAALVARHARRGFALTLGRICPEKGQHLAIEAARRADMPLLIAGEAFPYPEHVRYLREEVMPRLAPRRRWVGPVGFARKRRLLTAARCVLIPSLAAETSSLVAMEAAACGTPVVAFAAGALPETVRDGVTGYVVRDMAEMAEAIGRVAQIDPAACRAHARATFDARRMRDEYLARYGDLACAR